TSTHTIQNVTCEKILACLSDDAIAALERWRRIVNLDSTHLGGRGHTLEQMSAAVRAWDELPLAAQNAYFSLLDAVAIELEDAIRAVGIPEAAREIDAIEALLGPDHPALRVLPGYALASAFREALERVAE